MSRPPPLEGVSLQRKQGHVGLRTRRRLARRVAHDADLAEELAVAQRLRLDLAAVRLLALDRNLTLDNDEDLVGGSALAHDDLAAATLIGCSSPVKPSDSPAAGPEDAVDHVALEIEAELLVVRAAASVLSMKWSWVGVTR